MSELKGACIIGQSGGPTSVINASAYGVIRTALDSDCITAVYGAEHGIKGVLADRLFDISQEDPKELELLKYTPSSALGSCRYKMKDPDEDDTDYKRILEVFKKHDVRYFFYNGGNDSMDTCNKISKYMQKVGYECRVMGVPKTIDNDLYGTDSTIGYDTTMNTIVECVDRIRDTAQSHERIFFIEVMGRDAGFLAQNSAIASGAEAAIIPEDSTDVDQLARFMERGIRKSKKSCIVIVSESPKCGAMYYAERVRNEFPQYDVRVSILGHLQRGGRPSAHDRILASRTGVGAIEAIVQGQRNVMIGVRNNEIVYVPLSEAIRSDKPFDRKLIQVLDELSI